MTEEKRLLTPEEKELTIKGIQRLNKKLEGLERQKRIFESKVNDEIPQVFEENTARMKGLLKDLDKEIFESISKITVLEDQTNNGVVIKQPKENK